MTKNIEPCANCPAEIYQASDLIFYHLKTGNLFCSVGTGYIVQAYAGKVAGPKVLAHGGGAGAQRLDVPGNGF